MTRTSFLASLALLGVVGLTTTTAQAQFAFTNIADIATATPAGGIFNGFSSNALYEGPSISGNNVAFYGAYSGGTGTQGIFVSSGGALTTIATGGTGASAQAPGGGTFQGFNAPSISGSNVAFVGAYSGGTGTQGIFVSSGGALTTIATGGTGASAQAPGGGTFNNLNGANYPSISGSNVAFRGDYTNGTGREGVFAGSGGALTTIATGTFQDSFATNPGISGSTVAFRALNVSSQEILTGSGGALTTIANTTTTQVPGGGNFFLLDGPTISGNNVAFVGYISGGGTGSQGIFVGSGGALTTIVTGGLGSSAQVPGGGTFNSFQIPSISGSNIAFYGDYTDSTTKKGIFISNGGSLSKVISTTDTLFGSTVTALSFGTNGLDGNNLAFKYTLADGRIGIALATLSSAPEPGTLVFLALGGALVLTKRRLRK